MPCFVVQCIWLFLTLWAVALQAPLSMGILQARILEWVAMLSSRGSSQPRARTQVSTLQADSLLSEHQGSPRILEWVAYPFSRGTSWPRNQTRVSWIVGRFSTTWATREAIFGFLNPFLHSFYDSSHIGSSTISRSIAIHFSLLQHLCSSWLLSPESFYLSLWENNLLSHIGICYFNSCDFEILCSRCRVSTTLNMINKCYFSSLFIYF